MGKAQKGPIIPFTKSVATRYHLLSLLLHGNILQNLKIIFLNPNINLKTIFLKPKYYLGNYFTKPKILFWQKQLLYTQNPNAILAHAYKTQILFLTLALHALNPSLMGNIIIYPLRNISLTRFIKAHVHHPWQNYSSCRVNQAQASLSAKPS